MGQTESKRGIRPGSRWHLLGGAACAALAGWIAAVPAVAADWAEIEKAAQAEGTVMVYHNLRPQGAEPLMEDFKKANPNIKAPEQMRLGSAPLIERFSTEFAADRNVADVMITYPDERVFDGIKNGWATEWTPPEIKAFPAEMNVDNKMFAVNQAREAIIWNKQKVKAADAPKEWEDLFDAKWKGRIGMNPPWRSISVQSIVALWEEKGITDAAQKLKDLDVRFFEGSSGIIQAVIRGDVHVAELSDLPLNPMLEDGAPVGFAYPKSGTTVTTAYIWVSGKAPHPNAGKVFVNWILSAEGQNALQKHGGLSATRPGTPPLSHIPATESLPNTVDSMKLVTPERQKKMIEEWRTVFGVR